MVQNCVHLYSKSTNSLTPLKSVKLDENSIISANRIYLNNYICFIKQSFKVALTTRLSMNAFLLKLLQLHNVDTKPSRFSDSVCLYTFIFLGVDLLSVQS